MLKDEQDKPIDMQVIPKIAPTHRLQWEEVQQCYVVLYPEGMVKLNPSSAEILKECDACKTVKEIVDTLHQRYPDASIKEDVLKFLEVAYENGWIKTK